MSKRSTRLPIRRLWRWAGVLLLIPACGEAPQPQQEVPASDPLWVAIVESAAGFVSGGELILIGGYDACAWDRLWPDAIHPGFSIAPIDSTGALAVG